MEHPPERNKPDLASEAVKWNAILASEGMPAELEGVAPEADHTPAYMETVSGLYIHYATAATGDHGAHRHALQTLREQLKAAGGTEDELESLDEDFARNVEDAVTDLQKSANNYALTIATARPMLASGRPENIARMVSTKLKEDTDGAISREALDALALKAATWAQTQI